MQDSHRRRTRVPGQFDGTLRIAGRDIPIETSNISLKGLLCLPQDPATAVPLDQNCEVRIHLTSDACPLIQGRTVRRDEEGPGVAVDFTGMDEESYGHLRNIVRYSAKDPDFIDFEQAVIPFKE